MSKFKIIKDYQLTTEDKKIIILKAKVFIVDYLYVNKDIKVKLDPLLVNNNPDYFQFIDWKTDLVNHLKINKIAQPSVVAKKLYSYIEENFIEDQDTIITNKLVQDSDNSIENEIKDKYEAEITKLLKLNTDLIKTNEKKDAEILELNDLNNELDKSNKNLESNNIKNTKLINDHLYKITKLEVELSNISLENSKYSENLEEEVIKKMKEVNERLEAIINRESEVRSSEMEVNNTLRQVMDIEAKNNIILNDIDSREKAIDLKLNDIIARERHLEAFDKEKIIEDAILEYEKSIPWQYWRDKK